MINDDIVTTIETENGLRGLLKVIELALRFRARVNSSDGVRALEAGNENKSFREQYEADARIRNAELIGFVIDNLHSYEPRLSVTGEQSSEQTATFVPNEPPAVADASVAVPESSTTESPEQDAEPTSVEETADTAKTN